jgi:hypothetical protein
LALHFDGRLELPQVRQCESQAALGAVVSGIERFRRMELQFRAADIPVDIQEQPAECDMGLG